MIPYFRPKLSDLYTLSQSKLLENHTLHSGSYLYNPYMAVPPFPPPPHRSQLGLRSGFLLPFFFRMQEEKVPFFARSLRCKQPHSSSNIQLRSTLGIICGQGIIRGAVKIPRSRAQFRERKLRETRECRVEIVCINIRL